MDGEVVDVSLDSESPGGIFRLCQEVILGRDTIEPRFLLRIVGGADLLRALEEEVLEVMSDARVGTILGASLDNDGTEDLRLRMIFIEPHRHAVGEREGGQRRALGKKLRREKEKKKEEI